MTKFCKNEKCFGIVFEDDYNEDIYWYAREQLRYMQSHTGPSAETQPAKMEEVVISDGEEYQQQEERRPSKSPRREPPPGEKEVTQTARAARPSRSPAARRMTTAFKAIKVQTKARSVTPSRSTTSPAAPNFNGKGRGIAAFAAARAARMAASSPKN